MATPNITILYNDKINLPSTSVSAKATAITNYPGIYVQHPHLGKPFRTLTTTLSCGIVFDLGSAQNIDAIYLLGTNLKLDTGSIYMYVHTSDLGTTRALWNGVATAVDTGPTLVGDHFYGYFNATQSKRYIAVYAEYTAPADGYVQWGRIMAGLKTTFTRQFMDPVVDEYIDKSKIFETEGDQTTGISRPTQRRLNLDFDLMLKTDREAWQTMFQTQTSLKPMVVHLRADSAAFSDDLMYGRFDLKSLQSQFLKGILNRSQKTIAFIQHR